MLDYPADLLALAAEIPPPKEWIVAKMILPSGDVWVSDRPVSPALLALLPDDPLPIVEDWGTLDDGGGLDKVLAASTSGFLCCPKTRIVLIRADQTKTDVDAIISQGIHNRRFEIYRWFNGMISAPVLIDILFCQDSIELKESSMLFSFDAVGALASENPYMTDRSAGNKTWPYLVGKAEGVPLELLEEQSSKWTVLLGDQDGNEIDEEYTGLIRVEDATRLSAGDHLVNGEQVTLAVASAGYMELTARAKNFTEAQEHANGSRMFPFGVIFKYAVCAGPIGSFESLRTSNEIDIYDEDGDLDTEEYRDLYSGGNEEFHPELNPAQIWFDKWMPFLWKDQELDLSKVFQGQLFNFNDAVFCRYPADINKEDGKSELKIPYPYLTIGGSGVLESNEAPTLCPSLLGDGPTYSGSESISSGHFDVEQVYGDPGYREFRVNSSATPGEEAATIIAISPPVKGEEFYNYEQILLAIPTVICVTSRMSIKIDLVKVTGNLGEQVLWTFTAQGAFSDEIEHAALTNQVSYANLSSIPADNDRLMFRLTCLANNDPNSYAYIRIGGETAHPEGNISYQSIIAFWAYHNAEPMAWIESRFSRNLSSRGVFVGAEARVTGVVSNNNNKASGAINIYDGLIVAESVEIPQDGSDIEFNLTLNASSWVDLSFASIRIEMQLTGLEGDIDNGAVSIELNGVEWIISYVSSNLDSIQINYTNQLYVDAVSTRGTDWTPARAFKYLSDDKTNWAIDLLDNIDLEARSAEFVTPGHYLNGLLTSERYQDAIKEIMRQGFCLPVQSAGKVSIQSYLSWPAVVSVIGDNNSLLENGKTFSTSDTLSLIQLLVIDYAKNFSTGIFDNQYELTTGEHVENMDTISLDLVSSDTAVQQAAAWLFGLKSQQLKILGFDGNFRLIESQRWDKVNLPDFLAGDLQEDMVVVSIGFQFAQPKNDKPSKLIINTIKV